MFPSETTKPNLSRGGAHGPYSKSHQTAQTSIQDGHSYYKRNFFKWPKKIILS